MKTVSVVFERNGELARTSSPKAFFSNWDNLGGLSEQQSYLVSYDDFGRREMAYRYYLADVEMPEWATEHWYLANYVKLRFALYLGGHSIIDFSEERLTRFFTVTDERKYLYQYLMSLKNPSPFFLSIIDAFNAWLDGNSEHKQPLSEKQLLSAGRYAKLYNAKKLSTELYNKWS